MDWFKVRKQKLGINGYFLLLKGSATSTLLLTIFLKGDELQNEFVDATKLFNVVRMRADYEEIHSNTQWLGT